jgi:hypothetical protein
LHLKLPFHLFARSTMHGANKWLLSGLIAVGLLMLSASSRAQDAAPAGAGAGASGAGGDYGYKFEDDPLSAGGFGPSDAISDSSGWRGPHTALIVRDEVIDGEPG